MTPGGQSGGLSEADMGMKCMASMSLQPRAVAVALALLAAACSDSQPAANDSAETAPAAPPAAASDPQALPPLTAEGWGPLRIGMTLAEVTAALGPDSDPDAVGGPEPESCDQFRPKRAPEGMLVMIEEGRLTRITVTDQAEVKTDRGLGPGIPAAAVRAAYGSALQAAPHEYEDAPAEYLTIWSKGGGPADRVPPANSRGIRYEVGSTGTVAMIHAGGPSITYVEGCA
jgi:hypothetical protein